MNPNDAWYRGYDAGWAARQSDIDRLKNLVWDLERRLRAYDPQEKVEQGPEDG